MNCHVLSSHRKEKIKSPLKTHLLVFQKTVQELEIFTLDTNLEAVVIFFTGY